MLETILATLSLGIPCGPRLLCNFKFSPSSVKIPCNVTKDLFGWVNNAAPDVK